MVNYSQQWWNRAGASFKRRDNVYKMKQSGTDGKNADTSSDKPEKAGTSQIKLELEGTSWNKLGHVRFKLERGGTSYNTLEQAETS